MKGGIQKVCSTGSVGEGRTKNVKKVSWDGEDVVKKGDVLTQFFSVFISPAIHFFLLPYLMGVLITLKRQPPNIVKHTQTIRRQMTTNCMSLFDHFVGLTLKGMLSDLLVIKITPKGCYHLRYQYRKDCF